MRKVLVLSALLLTTSLSGAEEKQSLSEKALYFGVGAVLETAAIAGKIGWGLSRLSPWNTTIGNECLLLSRLCSRAASQMFAQGFKGIPSFSRDAWHLNQSLLSEIPTYSQEDQKLMRFLERRYLAKSAGFFPVIVDWICPAFRVFLQVHPETQNCYARNPSTTVSDTYKKRAEAWKEHLPQPKHYPLVLTRPANLYDYFPTLIDPQEKVIVDLTAVFSHEGRDEWLEAWEKCQEQFKARFLEINQMLCIQYVEKDGVGGIRILPFSHQSAKEIEEDHQLLLERVAFAGLSASRVELDRLSFESFKPKTHLLQTIPTSKEDFIASLDSFQKKWKSRHPQKNLMVRGTLQVLQGFFDGISEDKWREVLRKPTHAAITHISLERIQKQLERLVQEEETASFFEIMSHLELIHANLMPLLEVFALFKQEDFPSIYENLLTTIPSHLKAFTTYGIHASGMTSMAGILHATKKMLGRAPRVLFGENTYFECLKVVDWVSTCVSVEEATKEDWGQVDLILAQFNPALKRIDLLPTEYREENVMQFLQKSFKNRNKKPLILALDCTFDYIDSPRVGQLLEAFQSEIEKGYLNIICYRSGLKFDLFGMDNYSGAPLYMIHNRDPHWAPFEILRNDPALKADSLSLNWFCLAYKNAAPTLELYRKQIFDNTRALLERLSPRLYDKNSPYRVIPFRSGTDPTFIDIKVSGPLHKVRGSALAGGLLYLRGMEQGYPIFYRRSVGFYHSNFSMLFCDENATIRLTVGLDAAEVDLLAETFEILDTLNGATEEVFFEKVFEDFIPNPKCEKKHFLALF